MWYTILEITDPFHQLHNQTPNIYLTLCCEVTIVNLQFWVGNV